MRSDPSTAPPLTKGDGASNAIEDLVTLYLVHHGDAVGPDVDPQRPLSNVGRAGVDRLAAATAARGVKPQIIWHSGKLRAKQTAEAFYRACNPFAEFSATPHLQPGGKPEWI